MAPITRVSPIDGSHVQFVARLERGPFGCYQLADKSLHDLFVGEEMDQKAPSDVPYKPSISLQDTRAAWNLIRSKLWKAFHEQSTSNICLVTEAEYARMLQPHSVRETTQHIYLPDYTFLTFEQQIEEARNLTFTEKCLRTLEDVYIVWRQTSKPVGIQYTHNIPGQGFVIRPDDNAETGMAYGCDRLEAIVVYKHLMDEGYLSLDSEGGNGKLMVGFFILSPKGLIEVDRLQRGRNASVKRAFFIRRWDTNLDIFMRPVMNEVEKRTGCEIKAVWEDHHNDKIDERILRSIKEASVVVLDVAPDRFNVGFEAGYALALNKPIVTMREKPTSPTYEYPPFDIATMNCYDYERSKPEELIDVLSARILNALEQAKLEK